MPAIIGFVVDETVMTRELISAIADSLQRTDKAFQRVCFIGADKKRRERFTTCSQTDASAWLLSMILSRRRNG